MSNTKSSTTTLSVITEEAMNLKGNAGNTREVGGRRGDGENVVKTVLIHEILNYINIFNV